MRPQKISVDDVVNYIVSQLDRYTVEAIKSLQKSTAVDKNPRLEDITKYLYERIQEKLFQIGKSLDDIQKNEKYLAQINEHGRLKAVLEYHAKFKHNNDVSPDKSLLSICKEIFNSRDRYWNLADKLASDNKTLQIFYFTLIIQAALKSNGFSFHDVKNNDEVKEAYFSSGRLQLALNIFYEVFSKNPHKASPEQSNDNAMQKHFERRAAALAKAHAHDQGLVTQLGFKKDADIEELAKAAKKIMIQEHPDRKADADVDKFALANELKQLNDQGVLNQYLAALKAHRADKGFEKNLGK